MWQVLLENLIPLIFTIITPVILVFVNRSLKLAARKWDLQEVLTYEDKVDELILKGIRAAEQKSLTAAKKEGPLTSGEEKLEMVLQFVNGQLQTMKLPQKAGDHLAMLVEAKIFEGAKEQQTLPRQTTAPAPGPVVPPAGL